MGERGWAEELERGEREREEREEREEEEEGRGRKGNEGEKRTWTGMNGRENLPVFRTGKLGILLRVFVGGTRRLTSNPSSQLQVDEPGVNADKGEP